MSFPSSEICILLLSANPKGSLPLRLEEEKREIESGLERSQYRDRFRLVKKEAVRNRDLQRAMLDLTPQVVHFSGHGTGAPGLVFEDDIGQVKLIDAAALAGLFALFSDQLQCVVLNACYSELQAEAIAQHIPYVIGMSDAIGDRAAIEFAVGFYDALGAGRDIEFAHKLGCQSIRMTGIPENLIPVLKHRSNSLPIASTQLQDLPVPEVSSASLPASASRSALLGDRFLKPKRSKPIRYSWLLAGVAVACLGAIGLVPQVREMIGNREPDCFEKAAREKKLIVAIAQIQQSGTTIDGTLSFFQDQISDYLRRREKPDVEICTINYQVANEDAAGILGRKLGASIVIWGRQNPSLIEVKVTTLTTQVNFLTSLPMSLSDAQDPKLNKNIPLLINIMVSNALSSIYQVTKSQKFKDPQALDESLRLAKLANLDLKKEPISKILSKAYFLLGGLYALDREKCLSQKVRCEKAVDAFAEAVAANPTLYQAFIEQGAVLESIGDLDRAASAYTQLIQVAPPLEMLIIAHGNRAAIYMKQGKYQQAAKDLDVACQHNNNPYYADWLSLRGQLELLTGRPEKAQSTFREIKEYVEDSRELKSTLAELSHLAQQRPDLKSIIQSIINHLEDAPD